MLRDFCYIFFFEKYLATNVKMNIPKSKIIILGRIEMWGYEFPSKIPIARFGTAKEKESTTVLRPNAKIFL